MKKVFSGRNWFMDGAGWFYAANGTKLARIGKNHMLFLWDKKAKCEVAIGLVDLHRAELVAALQTESVELDDMQEDISQCVDQLIQPLQEIMNTFANEMATWMVTWQACLDDCAAHLIAKLTLLAEGMSEIVAQAEE